MFKFIKEESWVKYMEIYKPVKCKPAIGGAGGGANFHITYKCSICWGIFQTKTQLLGTFIFQKFMDNNGEQ